LKHLLLLSELLPQWHIQGVPWNPLSQESTADYVVRQLLSYYSLLFGLCTQLCGFWD